MRSADSAEINKQVFQWVDVVAVKKKNNMATNNNSVESGLLFRNDKTTFMS